MGVLMGGGVERKKNQLGELEKNYLGELEKLVGKKFVCLKIKEG